MDVQRKEKREGIRGEKITEEKSKDQTRQESTQAWLSGQNGEVGGLQTDANERC